MRLGLLVCDPDRGFEAMYAAWLQADWRIYNLQHGEWPSHLDECDAYVVTGSKESVYDDKPWIHQLAVLTRQISTTGKPFIGVCFGHQMLGHALGGRVAKSPNGWGIGVHTFQIQRRQPWMQPAVESYNLIMSCQDQVLEQPPQATVLAGNAHCPVGLFQTGRMLGIQGHPEFTAVFAEDLLNQRRDRLGSEKTDAAIATLRRPLDGPLFAKWAIEFLRTQ